MAGLSTQEMAVEAIVILNAAFTNVRLYPPTSDIIDNSVNNAYSVLQSIFDQDDSVIYAESEGNLIVSGQVLGEADKKKPQVISFIKLMTTLSIKSISFEKGLKKEEILPFLEVVSKKSKDLEKEGGASEVLASRGIQNIHIDKKLFIAIDEQEKRKEEQRKQKLLRFQNGINRMLKGNDDVFMDLEIMRSLPAMILRMLSQGKEKNAVMIINRLCKGLFIKKDGIRAQVSVVMAHITIRFMTDNRTGDMARLIPWLVEWIKIETNVSSAYKNICIQLRDAARSMILNRQFSEGNQILKPFHLIYSNSIKLTEETKKIAGEILEFVASRDVLDLLLNEINRDGDDLKEQALKTLALLESVSADSEVLEQLKSVDKHVAQGDTESAVKLLFDITVKYAKQKDFEKANLMRDKLLEVNSMALSEIVKTGEVIEEEMSEGIDPTRLKIWSQLYDKLNQAETNAVYFAMKSAEFDANETIFRQGETNSRLYFINSGKIKLITNKDGKDILIKELGTGDMFGNETFLSLTVCTISAITTSNVELDFLEKDIVTTWEKDSPGLAQKINDHCLKLEKASEILIKQGKSRREYERVDISGRISMQVFDLTGSPIGRPLMGNLADISMGGVSFYIKASKEKADKMFLDRLVNLKFNIKAGDSEHKVDQNGIVVGLIPHLYNYSVHIKFDNMLDKKLIEVIKK